MDQFRFGEDYHNGHEFDLPRLSTSVCRGCGDTWSKIVSNTRWCGEATTIRSDLIPASAGDYAAIPAAARLATEAAQTPFKRRGLWGWMTNPR